MIEKGELTTMLKEGETYLDTHLNCYEYKLMSMRKEFAKIHMNSIPYNMGILYTCRLYKPGKYFFGQWYKVAGIPGYWELEGYIMEDLDTLCSSFFMAEGFQTKYNMKEAILECYQDAILHTEHPMFIELKLRRLVNDVE